MSSDLLVVWRVVGWDSLTSVEGGRLLKTGTVANVVIVPLSYGFTTPGSENVACLICIMCMCALTVTPMDYSPWASSVCEILQARILEWVAISFSRESSPTQGSNLGLRHCRQILYHWATWEALCISLNTLIYFLMGEAVSQKDLPRSFN